MCDKIVKKLVAFFIGSEDIDLVKDVKPLMNNYNYKSFRFSTISFLPFLVILTVASALVEKMRWMFWGYLFFLVAMTILFIMSKMEKVKKNSKLILFLLYVEIVFSLTFALLLGNYADPKIVTVSYHVFLIALPLFVCDSPWHLNVIYLIFAVPFIITSYYVKEDSVFKYDFFNCIIYTILGMFVNTGIQISHFDSFSNRCLRKKQRDTDTLTGTLTKKAFELRVQAEMRHPDSKGAFMIFDIDNFKNINDTLGHAIGDYFISNTGHLILNHCRQTDIVGRFGGDEFVIFMPGVDSIEIINKKANEFMSSLKEYITKNMNYEDFSISIGSTIYDNPGQTYKEIFDEMDTALYDAKRGGKDKCCIYNRK